MSMRLSFGPRRNNSAIRAALGAVVCLGLSIIGFTVVLSGENISGGLPFVPHSLNQWFARVLFALGALLTAVLALYGFYEAFTLSREKKKR